MHFESNKIHKNMFTWGIHTTKICKDYSKKELVGGVDPFFFGWGGGRQEREKSQSRNQRRFGRNIKLCARSAPQN